uniref:Sh3rf1 protein n=1 Tax=Fopius arisanus TaxID=64838 RepID=A0A0C9QGW1_9HYME
MFNPPPPSFPPITAYAFSFPPPPSFPPITAYAFSFPPPPSFPPITENSLKCIILKIKIRGAASVLRSKIEFSELVENSSLQGYPHCCDLPRKRCRSDPSD